MQGSRGDAVGISNGVSVVSLGKVKTDIVQGLALGQVMVVGILHEGRTHTTNKSLRESVEDVERGHIARSASG